MTPILAAGFQNVADSYGESEERIALTTGLFMLGLGVGSVVVSPTAILYGKRPVYLFSAVIFIGSSIWCALAPDFNNLVVARILQGMAVSPVECLPSATIAEIFFLHERAFRVGIYTLLLLGGKNLVPLVSAAIIQSLEWRWVFWYVPKSRRTEPCSSAAYKISATTNARPGSSRLSLDLASAFSSSSSQKPFGIALRAGRLDVPVANMAACPIC